MMKIALNGPLSLKATFDCGQAFRFDPVEGGGYRGVVGETVLTLWVENGELIVGQQGALVDQHEIRHFLNLDRDYEALGTLLKAQDPFLTSAIQMGQGLKILRQDPFEMFVTFILSANSNMKRIKSQVQRLSEVYGLPLLCDGGETLYTFPDLKTLQQVSAEVYRSFGFGYRAEYLAKALGSFEGQRAFDELETLETQVLLQRLVTLPGIGEKVAACIAIFGYGRFEAFPVDVWIRRYFQDVRGLSGASDKQIKRHAEALYGPLAGLAQQYAFYYMLQSQKSS
jgi:N-glycosylase/DNA lyase